MARGGGRRGGRCGGRHRSKVISSSFARGRSASAWTRAARRVWRGAEGRQGPLPPLPPHTSSTSGVRGAGTPRPYIPAGSSATQPYPTKPKARDLQRLAPPVREDGAEVGPVCVVLRTRSRRAVGTRDAAPLQRASRWIAWVGAVQSRRVEERRAAEDYEGGLIDAHGGEGRHVREVPVREERDEVDARLTNL